MTPAETIVARLRERGLTIVTAESLTGGRLVATLVDVPGASAVVRGGIVAYATDLKRSVLGVDVELLERHGPVHPEVARQMAAGACRVLSADVGVSTTGIAGPTSPDGQPVGTVHIGIAAGGGIRTVSLRLEGDRDQIRSTCVRRALDAVGEVI